MVVLTGPDSERYTHGVLGDAIETTRVVLLERHSLRVMRELVLDAPHVFEDIAPRKVALGSRDGLLSVQSGPQGAQLVLVDADPAAGAALRVAARGPALGVANRRLAPTTDGMHWLAVHTPHIGGVLHEYRRDGDRLLASRVHADVSNHRIGSRLLDTAAWQGQRLLIPDRAGHRLLLLDARSNWREDRFFKRQFSSRSVPAELSNTHRCGRWVRLQPVDDRSQPRSVSFVAVASGFSRAIRRKTSALRSSCVADPRGPGTGSPETCWLEKLRPLAAATHGRAPAAEPSPADPGASGSSRSQAFRGSPR